MTQAANVIPLPRPAVHTSGRWDRGCTILQFPVAAPPVWSRADRAAMRAAARAFEGIAHGLMMTDVAMKDEVRRQLRELRLVRDPLKHLTATIAELTTAVYLLNRKVNCMTVDTDEFLDILDEAAEHLHSLIARPASAEAIR